MTAPWLRKRCSGGSEQPLRAELFSSDRMELFTVGLLAKAQGAGLPAWLLAAAGILALLCTSASYVSGDRCASILVVSWLACPRSFDTM